MITLFSRKGMLKFNFLFEETQIQDNSTELSIAAYITAMPALENSNTSKFGGTKLNKDLKVNFHMDENELLMLRALTLKEITNVNVIRENKSISFQLVVDNTNQDQVILASIKSENVKFTMPIPLIPFRYKLNKIIDHLFETIIKHNIKTIQKEVQNDNNKIVMENQQKPLFNKHKETKQIIHQDTTIFDNY